MISNWGQDEMTQQSTPQEFNVTENTMAFTELAT